ncbi:Gfo/Idh/MocA family oxidoreductase [Verrucomicrobiaceae bacterium N1E253]|uniref:Gfo/Idh/MocA family oxidoreductase n=1 Tax=Oceaniferula marina TaxID=2748318 RepID=A0A851GKU1_9BACT|nr:Gfo/Idh/MocA family oxidoreductase [Oceaniferula marina]NWK55707.1 Gfo/Idh/MocA family oxidoreductase [Oceaniferula marina]
MSDSSQPLTLAAVGCGSRARTYSRIAMSMEGRYSVVAGADPIPDRVEALREISQNPDFRSFDSANALLEQERMADVLIIGTQDNYHYEPAKKALELGYHLLLEKPAAQTLEETMELARLAEKYDRKILLCFVLRYTPFYSKVNEILRSGRLGEVISMHATEGVDAWHQSHSFVRGHWGKSSESTPMIVAKCSHDTDYIAWLMQSRCKSVSSYGRLSYFTPENAPEGATARCTSGCPHAAPQGGSCMYDTHQYLGKHSRWLDMVYPNPNERPDEEVLAWLDHSPWGRCAWKCDNDVVDHQVVNMDFENGATASLTMTAFDFGRSIEIYGTKATLRGGDAHKQLSGSHFSIRDHDSGEIEMISLAEMDDNGYQGHGGGDYGLVDSMDAVFRGDGRESSTISCSVEGHIIGFAAEQSRLAGGEPVTLADLRS